MLSEQWPLFIHDFVNLYGRDKMTAVHYTTAKNSFVKTCGDMPLSEVGRNLGRWVQKAKVNPNTMSVYMDALASFGKWARKRGLITEDWFDGIKRKDPEQPIPKALRWTEALVHADNCYGLRLSVRDRCLILFLIHTGARASEAVEFPLHNLDMNENKVVFTKTKGKVARVVYFGPKFKKELEDYLAWRESHWPDNYWLFPSKSGQHMTVEDAQAIPQRYRLGVTLHQFRHTFITQVLRQTKNIKLAQELAGHKSILTTSRYLRIWDDEKQSAALVIEGDETQEVNKKGKRITKKEGN